MSRRCFERRLHSCTQCLCVHGILCCQELHASDVWHSTTEDTADRVLMHHISSVIRGEGQLLAEHVP